MRTESLPSPTVVKTEILTALTPASVVLESGMEELDLVTTRCAARIADPPETPMDQLEPPARARPRKRHLFDPARGWFRRFERATSLFLSRNIYPRIPLLHRVYDRQLRHNLSLSEASISIAGLPAAFDGMRILLITDPHAGPFLGVDELAATFDRLVAHRPDLILLGGDMVTSRLCEFESHLAAWKQLRAPEGVYAVLGNHDHYTGKVPQLSRQIEAAGIRLLQNESVRLERGDDQLSLAGVDDLLRGEPDLDAALRETDGPVILLSHNPDVFFDAVRRGVALMLSGHTHGGQIRLPGLGVLVRQSRYRLDEGRYRTGKSELLVSRGLGAVGLPWRLHCSPEAVLLTLSR